MHFHTDTSYQQDILKVKKIWDDLQDVEKQSSKKAQSQKPKNNNKPKHPSKYAKKKHQLQPSKSQCNTKISNQQVPTDVITFSTAQQRLTKLQPTIEHPQRPITNMNSRYLENHNLKASVEQKDKELSLLRVSNQRLKDQLARLENEILEKDRMILKFKQRQNQLLGATSKFNSEKVEALSQSVEYMNYKNDSKRLLKMLEATEEHKNFAKLALEDDGVRHLGNVGKKSKISGVNDESNGRMVHFCSCNKEFIPEENFWVPEKVYDFGKGYVKEQMGEAMSEAEVELLLYELNKIWREREKRIINWVRAEKAHEVGKYKRREDKMRKEMRKEEKE